MIFDEGRFRFDFSGAVRAEKMDGDDSPMPNAMKKVDFLVEEEERLLLIEVKDYSHPETTQTERTIRSRRVKSGDLINQELVPKCRDTYTYLHLMDQVSKPITYVVVWSAYEHKLKKQELFGPLADKLRQVLKKEARRPWTRDDYVRDAVILNVREWNRLFPSYPATTL